MIRSALDALVRRLPEAILAPPATEGEAAIALRGVTKRYGDGPAAVEALRGIDLQVARGQLVVVLGPSGSGKTTLLNVIGGIEPASAGSVAVDGVELGNRSADELTAYRRERIGFVFQFFNLIPTLTARENVALVAELAGQSEAAAEEALHQVGLVGRGDHFPAALSGGEQQRVAVARAIVKRPPVLLCDEPTGSLDLATGRSVLALLRRLNREAGLTVLLVTHNQAIGRMADRVVRMGSGSVEEDETQRRPIPAEEVTW